MNFLTTTPYDVGIDPQWCINFLKRLEYQQLPLNSAIIVRHDKICMETYYAPYTKETLHRMFSITKTFVAMAIGLLEEEGKLSLNDHIVDYFPEKLPKDGAYPYTAMLTIRDMLVMRTCHNITTFKAESVTDWVGSFFTTRPSHIPGTNFSYDTSSTHVLGALVEKLSGMKLLDYLRSKCLNELGFSDTAYILTDPNGVSMGGSGLCATSRDILLMMMLIVHDGKLNGIQYLPKDFVRDAKIKHSDPCVKHSTLEEMQGYGYQLWLTTHGGYVMFGMGGQLALYVPEKDIYMITTADTQGRQGGVQLIYDAFWEEIYDKLSDDDTRTKEPADTIKQQDGYLIREAATDTNFQQFINSRKLYAMTGSPHSPMASAISGITYLCDPNCCDVADVQVQINDINGTFTYTNKTGRHEIHFQFGGNAYGIFPDYNLKYAASAAWRLDDFLVIKIQIIDSAVGNLYIALTFKEHFITVFFKKNEESLFQEYNGVFSGHAK